MLHRIVASVERLVPFPRSGRIVPEFGRPALREIIVRPYRVVYRLHQDAVEIATVVHAARHFGHLPEDPAVWERPVVASYPDVLSGMPVFVGTRVPVRALMDYLEGGETIDDFIEGFPTVQREQVVAFLQDAVARATSSAS